LFQNHLYTLYGRWPASEGGGVYNWKEAGEHYSKSMMGKGQKEHVLQTWRQEDFRLPDELVILNAKGDVTGQKMTSNRIE
jgi:hypothetical protein